MIAFPGQTGFSVTNIKYAKRWYEFYNQNDIIRQRLVDEFEMSADYGMVPRVSHGSIRGYWLQYRSAVLSAIKQRDRHTARNAKRSCCGRGDSGGVGQ